MERFMHPYFRQTKLRFDSDCSKGVVRERKKGEWDERREEGKKTTFIITHTPYENRISRENLLPASYRTQSCGRILRSHACKTSFFTFSILIIKLLKLSMNKKLSNGFPSHLSCQCKDERKERKQE